VRALVFVVSTKTPFYRGRVAALGLLLAVFYWFAETGAHAWIFRTGSFSHELFGATVNELWMRSFTFVLLLGSALTVQAYLNRIQKIEERTRLLAEAVEHAGEAILITNRAEQIVYVNPALEQSTGYQAKELLGRTPAIFQSGTVEPAVYAAMHQTIESGGVWQGQITDRRRDGSFYPAFLTIAPVLNRNGEITHFVGIQSDRSQQVALEQALQQAQKMEALGTLVGGIAHDFNNVLATILVHTELGVMKADDPSLSRRTFERIQTAANGAAGMVSHLMSFVRRRRGREEEPQSREYVEIRRWLANLRPTLEATLARGVRFELELPATSTWIQIGSHQLQEILLNLLKNASDALESLPDARVTLRILAPPRALASPAAPGGSGPELVEAERVLIRVEDNGPGVPQAIAERIFEPFFTTKGPGKGTGLGLAMVYDIARSVEGQLRLLNPAELEAEGRGGAVFELGLLKALEPPAPEPFIEARRFEGRGRKVLIADDQPLFLETAASLLSSLGLEVRAVPGGLEALRLVAEQGEVFELVLLDVTMPDLDGVQTAKQLRALHPELPILLATGYDHGLVDGIEAELPGVSVLEKPFDLDQLCAALNRTLNE